MASKDRILRYKEETRVNILDAALKIVKQDGWQSLSMRKIADEIEYTAPIIYEYFLNKEAILLELTRMGFLMLTKKLEEARNNNLLPADQLEAMWFAYWNFAFANMEYYQVMFGLQTSCCCETVRSMPEAEAPENLFDEVIRGVLKNKNPDEEAVCTAYYTCWSVVHGLISINIVRRGSSDEINLLVLKNAIGSIIKSMAE